MNTGRYYMLRSSNGAAVMVRRGMSAAKMTQGGGGWETVARPRRVALTRWVGRDPYGMDVPILFDGWSTSESVEADIARVNQMQMSPGDNTPPPTIQIDGALPVKGATWVMTIDWGDSVIWAKQSKGGYRLRQDAILHLLQYVPDKFLKVGSPNVGVAGIYVVKKGDTLKEIAKKWYGDVNKVSVIKSANGIRDPNNLKPGTTLRMPTTSVPTAHPVNKPNLFNPDYRIKGFR